MTPKACIVDTNVIVSGLIGTDSNSHPQGQLVTGDQREPIASGNAPDTGDDHLWTLLTSHPQGQLVTGDQLLLDNPPSGICVTSPRHFVDTFLSSKEN